MCRTIPVWRNDNHVPIAAIEHVQLAMPPGMEDAAREFYQGVLGIPEVPKPPRLAKRGGAWFERGSLKIHLGVEADFRPARKAHPALLVVGLETLITRLKEHNVNVIDDDPLAGISAGLYCGSIRQPNRVDGTTKWKVAQRVPGSSSPGKSILGTITDPKISGSHVVSPCRNSRIRALRRTKSNNKGPIMKKVSTARLRPGHRRFFRPRATARHDRREGPRRYRGCDETVRLAWLGRARRVDQAG